MIYLTQVHSCEDKKSGLEVGTPRCWDRRPLTPTAIWSPPPASLLLGHSRREAAALVALGVGGAEPQSGLDREGEAQPPSLLAREGGGEDQSGRPPSWLARLVGGEDQSDRPLCCGGGVALDINR